MKIPVLIGPTSSSKTSMALKVCENTGAHIISADSRQLYKFMDIGTGKTPANLADTKIEKNEGFWRINDCTIWGYDLVRPDHLFNAFEFAKFALDKINSLKVENKPVIVVGGTGFFVDSLTGRLELNAPQSDLELREQLGSKSLEELNLELEKLSPDQFAIIDKKNKIRVIRALERNLLKSVEKPAFNRDDMEFEFFGLTSTREILYSRVDKWAESVWGDALFAEVKYLIEQGFEDTIPLKGLVYKTVLQFLNQEISFDNGLERTKFDLHAYIRRQQTWFKKNQTVKWFDIAQEEDIVSIIAKSLYT